MRLILLCFSVVGYFYALGQSPNPKVQSALDAVLTRSEATSLYAFEVDWNVLKNECYLLAKEAQEYEDLKPIFTHILNTLRDHHGRILSAKDYSNFAYFTDYENIRFIDARERDPAHWVVMNDTSSHFEFALLPSGIGYLKVVGIGPQTNLESEALRIRQGIQSLIDQHVEKWILDLRFNTGGNVNGMLAGLAPLLSTDSVAHIVGKQNEIACSAVIADNNFFYCGYQAVEMPETPKIAPPKIALLLSSWTASSGELTAVAFKGQQNVRFFGENSAGYTTNTGGEPIGEAFILVISTGIFGDRNGTVYGENVPVDEYIPLTIVSDQTKDLAILAAIKWLN